MVRLEKLHKRLLRYRDKHAEARQRERALQADLAIAQQRAHRAQAHARARFTWLLYLHANDGATHLIDRCVQCETRACCTTVHNPFTPLISTI